MALVTGGTGFIGRHLVQRLVQEGWSVHLLVRSTRRMKELAELAESLNVYEYRGSIDDVLEAMETAQPSIVFHLAAVYRAQHEPENIRDFIDSNIRFGVEVLEAMTRHGCSRLVSAGTSWQHYRGYRYSPVNLYAATRQAFEDMLRYYVEAQNIRAVILKLFETYGPGDTRQKIVNLLEIATREDTELVMTEGKQLIDLVHVRDVVSAFLVAGSRLYSDGTKDLETYAVSSGQRLSVRQLVTEFQKVTNVELKIRWGARAYRHREVMVPWDGPKLPGWKPTISLGQGLSEIMSES